MCLAIPGEVLDVFKHDEVRFARVQFGGVTREVCLEYQPDARPGDFVLVHVGFAIVGRFAIDGGRQWELLRELGEAS